MAVEIPPEVADFLDCCGVRYPDIDEGDVRGLAVKVRTFAMNTRGPFGPLENSAALAAYERLVATWAGASGEHQSELDRVCAMVAKTLDAVAYVITVTKAVVLTELAALATTYAAMTATPAARITGPLVTAAARRLCVQMERALIGYIVADVIAKAIEPLGRSVDDMLTGPMSAGAAPTGAEDDPRQSSVTGAEDDPRQSPVTAAEDDLRQSSVTGAEDDLRRPSVTGAEDDLRQSSVTGAEDDLRRPPVTGSEDDPQRPPATAADDVVPAAGAPRTGNSPVTGGLAGPRGQPLGPSRSRGFVTPWARAIRASVQRASPPKTMPTKAFQSLDRHSTTARKPRETPWSKLGKPEDAPIEVSSVATVPTVRRRDRASEPGWD